VKEDVVSLMMREMGKQGGKKGGTKVGKALMPEERKELARIAADKRWENTRAKKQASE
jgi:hypothetical protein